MDIPDFNSASTKDVSGDPCPKPRCLSTMPTNIEDLIALFKSQEKDALQESENFLKS